MADHTPAPFGARFTAYMADAIVLGALQWAVLVVLGRQLQAAGLRRVTPCNSGPEADPSILCQGPSPVAWAIVFALLVASTFGWYAWFDGRQGATPGKRWAGLAVVDRSSGETIGPRRGLLRSALRQGVWIFAFLFVAASPVATELPGVIWFVAFGLSVLPIVWASFTPDGRGLHDYAVDSAVVVATQVRGPLDDVTAVDSSDSPDSNVGLPVVPDTGPDPVAVPPSPAPSTSAPPSSEAPGTPPPTTSAFSSGIDP